MTETHATVTEPNARARADRIIDGTVNPTRGLALHDGNAVSEGDLVDDMRQALNECRDLIESRADAVLRSALADKEPWTSSPGQAPRDKKQREAWWRTAHAIAAYRDRHGIADDYAPTRPEP